MTEYKKNDKGIWLPDNTNRQQGDQNEMPNITKNLSKFINYIPKITALFTVIGIFIGNLNIYNYLKHINFDFLFSDIIGNSSSAIAILLMHLLFLCLLTLGFLSPFFINILLNNISINFLNTNSQKEIYKNNVPSNKNNLLQTILPNINCLFNKLIGLVVILFKLFSAIVENIFFYENKKRDIIYYAKFVYWSMFWFIGIFTIIFFADSILSTSLDKYYSNILNFLTFVFIFFNVIYGLVFLNQNKLYKNNIWENSIWVFLIAMLHVLPVFLHFLFVIIPTLGVLKDSKYIIPFYIFSVIIFSLFLFFSYLSFKDFYKNKKYDYIFHIMSGFFVLVYLFCVSVCSNYEVSLYKTRFIEKPQNSSWYLIHNGNTTSENINGLSKRDILAQKDIFNAKDCTTLKNKDSEKKCQDDNKDIFNNRENALYGYMAWNLGNTKVFCPVSVDFFDDKDNTEKSEKCLVIDGKHLQLISKHHLQQPGG